MQTWKVPHIVKGMLTYVPGMNAWRLRRAATGGSNSSRYCYAVWLRHLTILDQYGFRINGAAIGELGPGDSIGAGLAALLSGADRYTGLDVVPYAVKTDTNEIFGDIWRMYLSREPIPGHEEFPRVRPRLPAYAFPEHLIDMTALPRRVARIGSALKTGEGASAGISYCAPWMSADDVEIGSLDLVFSQAVLQYVDDLEATYRAMFGWLKPGGYGSHSTGLGANDFSPFWNGHWAYTDREWRMLRGRREGMLNRQPLSTHLRLARAAGFDVLRVDAEYDKGGLPAAGLGASFRTLDSEDRAARGVMFILQKPRG